MKKATSAGAGFITAMLAAILLPPTAASAAEVACGDKDFVAVTWHPNGDPTARTACFAGAGTNWFVGVRGASSWMTYLRTGNNAITFVDCNGTKIDVQGYDDEVTPARCVAWINIKPWK
jgi:hypothetical protein